MKLKKGRLYRTRGNELALVMCREDSADSLFPFGLVYLTEDGSAVTTKLKPLLRLDWVQECGRYGLSNRHGEIEPHPLDLVDEVDDPVLLRNVNAMMALCHADLIRAVEKGFGEVEVTGETYVR